MSDTEHQTPLKPEEENEQLTALKVEQPGHEELV